jgi:carboxymethylenebutenolidase
MSTRTGPYVVRTRTISLPADNGATIEALITEPQEKGVFPGVAFGQEAMGPNRFGRRVASELASHGYVTITPDYYRGAGPSQPDNYDDFTEVAAAINALDFPRATFDVLSGVDWLRTQANVDPERVAVWGYCTGGTLVMLAASLDRRLAAAVVFFPSQPTYPQLTDLRPTHAMDLLWSIRCPVLMLSGDRDPFLQPDVLAEMNRRFDLYGVRHEGYVYPNAGHAFSADAAHMRNEEADEKSWAAATDFLERWMDDRLPG